jgi:hypothetical protein
VEGGNHARIHGATWVQADEGRALSFDGDDKVVVGNASELCGNDFTLSIQFRTQAGVDYLNETKFPRLVSTAPSSAFRNTSGYTIALAQGNILGAIGNGREAVKLEGEQRIDDGKWHQARLVRRGSQIRLYLDGELVGEKRYSGEIGNSQPFVIGGSANNANLIGEIKNIEFNTDN